MGSPGAPKGSRNAAKNRPFAEAIDKALKQTGKGKATKLRELAEKIIDMAMAGDMAAIKEVADRVDGKAQAQVTVRTEGKPLSEMTNEELAMRRIELETLLEKPHVN